MKLLTNHTTPETAYVVADYPYGFTLRCQIRYWLEFHPKRGFRFLSQTTNPKRGNVWNKPKASTYCKFGAAMYLDENEHVQWAGLSEYSDAAQAQKFLETYGDAVPEAGRDILNKWVAAKTAYEANREKGDALHVGLPEARAAILDVAKAVTRAEKLAAIWKDTHADFRGHLEGQRSIMVYRNGTCLVLLNDLTDAEIADKLPARYK